MALSERERQVLRDLEEQLHQEDPELDRSMRRTAKGLPTFSPRNVGAGIALVLVGLALVLGGVAVGHGIVSILVGLAGFAIAVFGVTVMLRGPESRRSRRLPRKGGTGPSSSSSFMDRQSQKWEQRRDQH